MSFVALKCPGCGANIQLDNTKEYGFCSYCGTKVVQDKIVVEHRGSVKIDTTEELKNLYVLARRAKESNDSTNAQKYYEQIIVKDPKSWEANFYTVYYQSMNCVIANITSAANNVTNNLASTFQLIRNNVLDSNQQRNAVYEIVYRVTGLSTALLEAAARHYNSIDMSVQAQYKGELDQRKNASINLCYYCGDYIESFFGENYIDLAVIAWKDGVNKSGQKTKANPYCVKIKQFDPDFRIQKPKFVIFGVPIIWFIVMSFVFAEAGNTWGAVYFFISLAAVVGYIVWNKVKNKKSKK
ncbi:MAG: hypothetical protein IJT65_04475 [Eubacterium sp.]|nr:hypothetical protein [Eubacterium sp.]